MGEIRLDEHMFRISDDYVNFGSDWWGGPFAQSIVMPAASVSLVKVTFRSGAGSTNAVNVYQGQDLSVAPVGSSSLSIPGNPGGGRGTACLCRVRCRSSRLTRTRSCWRAGRRYGG